MLPRLLIADRNRLLCESVAKALACDFDPISLIGQGPEVFASLARSPADLVVVDLCLPDLSGRQVVGELRLLRRDLRIVAMFEHDGPGYRESLRELGANGFCWKGASFDAFRAGVIEIAGGAEWVAVPDFVHPGSRACHFGSRAPGTGVPVRLSHQGDRPPARDEHPPSRNIVAAAEAKLPSEIKHRAGT